MGGRLAEAGHDVSLVTLGEGLAAIRCGGLRLVDSGAERMITPALATDDFGTLGPQDIVILAVKAHQIEAIAPSLPQLYHHDTVVITVQNGIPWWYFQRHGGPFDGRHIECLDPNGVIENAIPSQRVIGCVAYPAVQTLAPGVLRHVEGVRFPVGELDGSESDRVRNLADLFAGAGFKSPVLTDIRSEIWLKAVGSVAFNSISALTHATMIDMCRWPPTRALAMEMMREAEAVATKLGVSLRVTLERRMAGAEAVGAHKTSMLQDVEAGRRLEIDALVTAVLELARLTDTPAPHIAAVHASLSLLDRTLATTGSQLRAESRELSVDRGGLESRA